MGLKKRKRKKQKMRRKEGKGKGKRKSPIDTSRISSALLAPGLSVLAGTMQSPAYSLPEPTHPPRLPGKSKLQPGSGVSFYKSDCANVLLAA